jgi:hypothetical protein
VLIVQAENVAWGERNSKEDSGPLLRSIMSGGSFNSEDASGAYNKQSLLAAAKDRFDRNS